MLYRCLCPIAMAELLTSFVTCSSTAMMHTLTKRTRLYFLRGQGQSVADFDDALMKSYHLQALYLGRLSVIR